MTEAELRQVWEGLMPSFPEPATVLGIGDPDDRAVTMLLKTLYVVFKGVLDDRHQLRCCDRGTSSAAPSVTAAEPAGAGSPPASADEIVPPSPGDLVPPSPGNATHFSLPRRNVPVSAPPVLHYARPVVLAPETMDVASPPRGGRLPRPVAETAPLLPPPTEVWVPETLDASPVRSDRRPRPVVHETVPPPSTPPRPIRQPEEVSPLLPGRTPASRRARRAAGRAGAVSSPVVPPLTPPRATLTAAQASAAAAAVVSPTPSLSSPLLLPQRLPEMSRRQAAAEMTPAETPKDGTGGSTASSARKTSRLSRTKPSQAGGTARGVLAAGTSCQLPPAKKKKYMFIGPNDPVPPRKPRRAAGSPRKNLQRERLPSECGPTPAPQNRPPGETSAGAGEAASRSSCARATAMVTPTNTTAQSIFELSAATRAARKRSTAGGQTSGSGLNSGVVTGTNPKQKTTPKKLMEQRCSSAPMGTAAGQSQNAESVVELDVLLEELDRDGAQTQAQRQLRCRSPGSGQGSGQAKWQNSGRVQTGEHGDGTGREDLLAQGDHGVEEPEEAAAPPEDEQPEYDSQDETEMDSLVLGDEQPAAGPSYKYDAGPVRRRAERQKLPGWSCALCKEWYADRDMTEEELRRHMNRCSRHRQKDPPPPDTPPGFWDPIGLPSMDVTQYGDDAPRTRTRRKL